MADLLSIFPGSNPLAVAISRVEVRSAYSPPVSYSVDDLWSGGSSAGAGSGSGAGGWLAARIKPTLVIEGPLVNKVIAPYGVADPTEWKANATGLAFLAGGAVLGLFTLGVLTGRWVAKRGR